MLPDDEWFKISAQAPVQADVPKCDRSNSANILSCDGTVSAILAKKLGFKGKWLQPNKNKMVAI